MEEVQWLYLVLVGFVMGLLAPLSWRFGGWLYSKRPWRFSETAARRAWQKRQEEDLAVVARQIRRMTGARHIDVRVSLGNLQALEEMSRVWKDFRSEKRY